MAEFVRDAILHFHQTSETLETLDSVKPLAQTYCFMRM